MLCNKVSFESSWIVLTMILRIILRKNAWILEHNVELQEILHRTMQGIVSIEILIQFITGFVSFLILPN